MIIRHVCDYVQQACQHHESILGSGFFSEHVEVVARCANALAARLNADPEIITLAAYLHDISAIEQLSTLPEHPRHSAQRALEILTAAGYPQDRALRVARAISSHASPLDLGGASVEEVCLSNADAVARILRPAYWLYYAFSVRHFSFDEGRIWLRSLIETQWDALIEPARELAGPSYPQAIDMLGG